MKPPVADEPLLILDYDGTLAEVTDRPHEARPHGAVPSLLAELDRRYPLAILTGRQVGDLGDLLPVPGLRVIGVHGIEAGTIGGDVEALVPDHVLAQLQRVRADLPEVHGIEVEDKTAAIALHYRNAPDPDRALAELRAWSDGIPDGMEALWGKMVLEIRPEGHDKGRATEKLMAEHPDCTPVVIGDDTTDEEAFAAVSAGITIKVGPGETAARHRLPDVDAVVEYLRRYLR